MDVPGWSAWNVLCSFLYIAEKLEANPMCRVGRPKLPKTLLKAYFLPDPSPPCTTRIGVRFASNSFSARLSDFFFSRRFLRA